ncbi:hypothetical protein BBH88_12495 [Planococcus antarcticus DSM 14505]|uniref:Uncharacterized protein n=1 Tax=Planococcus antarcticus DSM 14505 TaxID=1185653 RepID=A0ABM6D684_9BACL|nr:hypothetical protein [Planococcus antarcticus]ANU11058.1 hypothetical protein BBH88_12495 [Planococcus antarcticus DSM 14505]
MSKSWVDPEAALQFITKNGEIAYLIYQSRDTVTAELEEDGDKLNIKLKTATKVSNLVEQHVYKLKVDKDTEVIEVLINGNSTPIDIVSGS